VGVCLGLGPLRHPRHPPMFLQLFANEKIKGKAITANQLLMLLNTQIL